MILWNTTSVLNALYGGLLIGLAASLLILFNGRIAGISGILGGLLRPQPGGVAWRVCFLLGLIISPLVYSTFAPLPTIELKADSNLLIIAGLLVGFGTRLGNGCTSGHGVCGMARLSTRSIVATVTFMIAGIITVFIMRTMVGA
jgi:uncharacterized membrane protein YedE/YeeE